MREHSSSMDPDAGAALPKGATLADELLVRLTRLEEQMRHLARAVDRLADRDAELDTSLRMMSDRFTVALSDQAELFRRSLREVTEKFVSREDWAFWRSLFTGALVAVIAYGWRAIVKGNVVP